MLSQLEWFYCFEGARFARGFVDIWVDNVDQRRWLTVRIPSAWPSDDDDADEIWYGLCARAKKLAAEHVETMAANVKRIEVDDEGNVTYLVDIDPGKDTGDDLNDSTYYPPLVEFQLPHDITKTLLRSDITELDRLGIHVDLVSYAGMEKGVFKYSHNWKGFGPTWQEINIHARIPRHPNIVPLDCLVLEEVSGARVVGFTTPFILGGDLSQNRSRPFKLKYLRQLMRVVDDLNYKYGISHQDMSPRNLLIDPATDNLMLFDFNVSGRIGEKLGRPFHLGETTRARETRNDVKGVVLTLHEILTRHPRYSHDAVPPPLLHLLDETHLLDGAPENWTQHPDVVLDPGLAAADYVAELLRWLDARRARPIASWEDASEPLDWPQYMGDAPEGRASYDRSHAEEHGLPFVEWVRPRWHEIDRSRRLLATGQYADDEGGEGAVAVAVQVDGHVGSDVPGDLAKGSSSTGAHILTGSQTKKNGRRHTRHSKQGRCKKSSGSASPSLAKRKKAKRTVTGPSEGLRRSPRLRGRTPVVYHFG